MAGGTTSDVVPRCFRSDVNMIFDIDVRIAVHRTESNSVNAIVKYSS